MFGILAFVGRMLTAIRNTVINGLLLVIIVIAVVAAFTDREPVLMDNSILVLSLAGDIVEEKQPVSAIARFLEEMDNEEPQDQEILLQDIVHIIDSAADDKRITAILLDMERMGSAGLDQLQTIGSALKRFRKTGRQVIAAEDMYTQKQYYLASYADIVAINPMGGVDLHGFGAYSLYFREALEKLKINFHVFRVGTYKSAVEPIIRDSMSPEAREQNSLWLTSLWNSYVTDVISEREIGRSNVDAYTGSIDSLLAQTGGDTARLALKMGLVDKIWTRSQVRAHLSSIAGTSSERDYTSISSAEYLAMVGPAGTQGGDSPNKVGILVAQGNILPGKQPTGVIGGDTLAGLIREARKDESVKAVVLRINSGGGSAFASEVIRQELLELKKSGKPLVVSMGTVAASGGYWIAADADEIWASPTTITGSIGIFGAIPTFENSLAAVGIRSDGTGTTPLAAGLDLTQPLSPQLKQSIQLSVDHGYRVFLDIVEKGRKIGRERLDSIAEGRVFDGRTAQKIGLVDRLGDLNQAVAAAARLAKIEGDYDPIYIKRSQSFVEQVLETVAAEQAALKQLSTSSSPLLDGLRHILGVAMKQLPLLSDPRGIYAQCFVPGSL
jgi:protease-4